MLILAVLLSVTIITFVSGIEVYSGETINLTVGEEYEYYSIIGNSSEVSLDVNQVGDIILIKPNKYSTRDTFEIIFFNKEEEVITIYKGGGGGSTKYVDRNITQYVNQTIIEFVNQSMPTIDEGNEEEIWSELTFDELTILVWISMGSTIMIILMVLGIRKMSRLRRIKIIERGLDKYE